MSPEPEAPPNPTAGPAHLPGELARVSTGVQGLDEVLCGGLVANRSYLVRGGPGSGKTMLGIHFLTAGVKNGERALFISLGEPEAQLRQNARTVGFDMTGMSILDLSPTSEFFTRSRSYDVFSPDEVERDPLSMRISERVAEVRPQRVFVDGMRQFQYLTPDQFQFRRQVSSFLRLLVDSGATVMFTSESELPDEDLQFVCDGALQFNVTPEARNMHVIKFRGSAFRHGFHAVHLSDVGMQIFPRLLPEEYGRQFEVEAMPSGIPALDEMLGGGLERGTISLITGPSGVGKTTLGFQLLRAAAERGERVVAYLFEESRETLLRRCESVGMPIRDFEARGMISIVQVEPLKFTPDHFARIVRQEVEDRKTRFVMIDSIAGYRLSLRGQDLVAHMHALAKYLQNMGVAVLLVNEVEAITGDFRVTEVGVSYMVDNILFMRYLEIRGELKKAIGVLKKRVSGHETVLREFALSKDGIRVGRPLSGLTGVLRGIPEWTGDAGHD